MKRMNEVFDLPIYYADAVSFTVNLTRSETETIVHVINNVDALADALEAAIPSLQYNRSISDKADKLYLDAVYALNAYRGAK